MTPNQLALLIKVQARWRGMLARRKIKNAMYSGGMAGMHFEEGQQDYDNAKVQEIRADLGDFNYGNEPTQSGT